MKELLFPKLSVLDSPVNPISYVPSYCKMELELSSIVTFKSCCKVELTRFVFFIATPAQNYFEHGTDQTLPSF